MGNRIAYFKTLRLGDVLRGPESLSLEGDDPQVNSALAATKPTISDVGGRSRYEYELKAHLLRSFSGAEASDAFFKRKLQFLMALKTARGWGTRYDGSGSLGILEDDAVDLYVTTHAEAAGPNVDVRITPAITVVDQTKWFITDGVSHEIFTANASSGVTYVQAATLANSYLAGATLFKVTFGLTNAYLLAGSQLEGNEPHANYAAREISLRFLSVDDPVLQP